MGSYYSCCETVGKGSHSFEFRKIMERGLSLAFGIIGFMSGLWKMTFYLVLDVIGVYVCIFIDYIMRYKSNTKDT